VVNLDKEELSTKVNELLGLKDSPIDFTKLSKDELNRLCEAVESFSLGAGVFGKKLLNRPVGELMDMRLRDVFKEIREGKGILGLGLVRTLIEERGKKA